MSCTNYTNTHPTQEFISSISSLDNSFNFLNNNASDFLSNYNFTNDFRLKGDQNGLHNIIYTDNGFFLATFPSENYIKVYNNIGELIDTIGGTGYGPGEFLSLKKVIFNKETKQVIALDRYEIEFFQIDDNGKLNHTFNITTTIQGMTDICTTNDYVFVNGHIVEQGIRRGSEFNHLSVSQPIHKFSIADKIYLESFGERYESLFEYGPYEGILSETLISCDSYESSLIGIFKHFPLIISYSIEDKSEKWRSSITNLEMVNFIEELGEGGPILRQINTNKTHFTYRELLNISEEEVLLIVANSYNNSLSYQDQLSFLKNESQFIPVTINKFDGTINIYRELNNPINHLDSSYLIISKPFDDLGTFNPKFEIYRLNESL
ncbi:MAG: hypothetical protein JJ895_07905 [Balneolaceae bacterium]|nr:hypothetical protein [Balneolaceae bacterium]